MSYTANIGHKKWRNTGILFELLVRQVTADTLNGLNESAALNIMKKYFNASTELGKELQLYRACFDAGYRLTEARAIHFIDLLVEQHKTLDSRKLTREKYELIKEIKVNYDLKDFLGSKIPNYTVHASIYKTFMSESVRDNSISINNFKEVAMARFTLVEHLIRGPQKKAALQENELLEEFRQQSEDLRLLAYKYVVDKFNEKYANLNDKQKDLLREYINNVSNTNSFAAYVRKEIPVLKTKMAKIAEKEKNKVSAIKLTEVAHQLDHIGAKREIKDNEVTALMIAWELVKEMES